MLQVTPDPSFGCPPSLRAPFVIGVDEAGRGPLAGPVVAAAVVVGAGLPAGVGDSKTLSAKRRAKLDEGIRASCAWAVAVVEPEEIDRINIFQATMEAMTRCVRDLCALLPDAPQEVLIDGNQTPERRCAEWRWPARAIIGGDGCEVAIGAASIIAKEWRDRLMIEAAAHHPEYGWDRNKGYGTREHMEALRVHGPTPLHRHSFAPVAQANLL
ncbi:MAG: ribonuclease HII [Erythrobacter sp.]|uniref:ribonuclease HII n=1 Tax=Erythrobacter sp. TaxID=1042 RepID=UPI003A887665